MAVKLAFEALSVLGLHKRPLKRLQYTPMYPKVKVKVRKEEEDADQYALELRSLQSLKGFENLSLHDSSPDESPTSVVRIPTSFISSSATSNVPESKGATMNQKHIGSEVSKKNIRASSVPRPRAVLSSPDNDALVGSKNKTREELLSGLKNHNLCQNRHTKCKFIPRSIATEDLVNTRRKPPGAGESKNDMRKKGRSIIDDRSRGARHRKVEPESLGSKATSNLTIKK